MSQTYECSGRLLTEPEGWIACYRAGHPCPTALAVETIDGDGTMTEYRCPCCGSLRIAWFIPHAGQAGEKP
jgi:hypothetical protein